MSDFSGLEQSFALAAMPPMALFDDFSYEPPPANTELQPREVGFLRLRGAHEIARILHLRDEIRLPAAVQADAGFAAREKKEMKSASSVRSCVSAKRSARSASFQ
jgi:hypothetical protein